MTFAEVLEQQWSDYPQRHRNRLNLVIHIVAVPMVWLASIWALGGILLLLLGIPGAFGTLFWSAAMIGLALFVQGRGNALEANAPSVPTSTVKDLLMRIAAEQFVTFPRFVLTGGWLENFRRTD